MVCIEHRQRGDWYVLFKIIILLLIELKMSITFHENNKYIIEAR